MATSDDKFAFWIAVLVITFSLIINVGIPAITGKSISDEPYIPSISIQQLEQGINLHRGINKFIIDEDFIELPAEDIFASIKDHIHYVTMGRQTFQQGRKIWLPTKPRYNKEISKYRIDNYYTTTITDTYLHIKVIGTDRTVWNYNLTNYSSSKHN